MSAVYLLETTAHAADGDGRLRLKLAVEANTAHDAVQRAGRITSRRWHRANTWRTIGGVTVELLGEYEVVR